MLCYSPALPFLSIEWRVCQTNQGPAAGGAGGHAFRILTHEHEGQDQERPSAPTTAFEALTGMH